VDLIDLDADCWWLFCGSECDGAFIGPHPSAEAAEADRNASGCDHDHALIRLTPRQMASKLPADSFRFCAGFHDGRNGRTIIKAPIYPHPSVGFADAVIRLMNLQLNGDRP
jgi:hypothetical protein